MCCILNFSENSCDFSFYFCCHFVQFFVCLLLICCFGERKKKKNNRIELRRLAFMRGIQRHRYKYLRFIFVRPVNFIYLLFVFKLLIRPHCQCHFCYVCLHQVESIQENIKKNKKQKTRLKRSCYNANAHFLYIFLFFSFVCTNTDDVIQFQ